MQGQYFWHFTVFVLVWRSYALAQADTCNNLQVAGGGARGRRRRWTWTQCNPARRRQVHTLVMVPETGAHWAWTGWMPALQPGHHGTRHVFRETLLKGRSDEPDDQRTPSGRDPGPA